MSALPRGFAAAQRAYEDMAPADPVEIDTAEYVDQLLDSAEFRADMIAECAREVDAAYRAKEHVPAIIDWLLDREAKRVLDKACEDKTTARAMHEACREMVGRFTRYDARAAA